MPFPEVQRIIFNRNPLEQVVCQLRFPTILKIDAEIPYEFQEKIREQFPDYSETGELKLQVPEEEQAQIPIEVLKELVKTQAIKNYQFKSEDNVWTINLTRTFLALTTTKYVRWEEFKEKLKTPLNAINEIYRPKYFSRIGLRYVNVIQRSKLSLQGISWRELLNPHILGLLGSEELSDSIMNFENKYELQLSDNESLVRIITQYVKSVENDEIAFKIDNDFFNTSKTAIEDANSRLEYFNVRGSRLMQWCITETLYRAMEPSQL